MRVRIIAASVTAAVTLAACGSSGGGTAGTVLGTGAKTTAASSGDTTGVTPSSGGATTASGGGGSLAGGDYCNTVKSAQARLDALGGKNSTTFLADMVGVVVILEQVASVAPDSIKPSWDLVLTKIKAFGAAITKAGITDKQLQNPASITPQQAQALEAAGQQVDSPDFQQATKKIETEVKTDCGVDISS